MRCAQLQTTRFDHQKLTRENDMDIERQTDIWRDRHIDKLDWTPVWVLTFLTCVLNH